MREKLEFVYGPVSGVQTYESLLELAGRYSFLKDRQPILAASQRVSERDVVLITYGDQLQAADRPPLEVLHSWLKKHLAGVINTVHILPFYPYTSDDGFSVVDYRQVDPALGSWDNIRALHADFRLMLDGVINHISASSPWFEAFLRGEEPYTNYFLVTDPAADLSQVTRPRALPLLTRFQTAQGEKYLWTTFSADQLDLNFANPQVFLNIAELLLFYVGQGADLIRLDAIGYLWKEIGTSCIHLPRTHALVQVLRAVLDLCAPNVLLITETNVPHRDNISYFGDGTDEAQLVYQFPLVPLVLNALLAGSARHLREWAAGLAKMSDTTTFFNFLASHDGIGVVPAKNILNEAEINQLVEVTLAHGGQVSYKNNPDSSQSPYELNITFFDLLSDPHDQSESPALKLDRFMVSQAIMLGLQGVPGIYFHSLLGSHNWQAGFGQTGRNRTLNREKLGLAGLEQQLADPTGHTAGVFQRYTALIRCRTAQPAFHPNAAQEMLRPDNEAVLAFVRRAAADRQHIVALHNLTGQPQSCRVELGGQSAASYSDLLADRSYSTGPDGWLTLELEPYQVLWLSAIA